MMLGWEGAAWKIVEMSEKKFINVKFDKSCKYANEVIMISREWVNSVNVIGAL